MLSQTVAVWLLIALCIAAANLPFVSERVLAVMPVKTWLKKPAWMIVVELCVLFVVMGLVGYGFETALVNPFPRGWEFYVTALCIFLVLGFPGFVYRYLLKK